MNASEQSSPHIAEARPSRALRPSATASSFCLWTEAGCCQTVGGDQIHFLAQQTLTLGGGDVTYCGKDICIDSGASLEGVLCHHVVITGLLVRITVVKGLIEGHIVAGETTAYHCCVSGEYGPDMRSGTLEIKYAGPRHPLMEMCHHAVVGLEVEIDKALYNLAGSISEKGRLYKVPLSCKGIEFEFSHRVVNISFFWL